MAPRKSAATKELEAKQTGPGNDAAFVYESPHGRIIVPSLAKLKFGTMRKVRKLEPEEQAFTIIEDVCGPDILAVVDELDGEEIGEFMEAWAKFSGVSVGE